MRDLDVEELQPEQPIDSQPDGDFRDEEDWDPDGLAYTLEVAQGMKSSKMSKRTAAETIWKAIAAGKAHPRTAECWVVHVAQNLSKDVISEIGDPKQRGTKALIALGLYGAADESRWMRDWLETYLAFRQLALAANPALPPLHRPSLVAQFRTLGSFLGVSHRAAAKRIDRMLEQIGGQP